jgi:NitT/TauT family transport system substrate-binding protein
VSSGIVTRTSTAKDKADLVRRFMAATTKAVEAAEKDMPGAVDALLQANPKGGQRDTLLEGFQLTTSFYKSPEGSSTRPFRVSDKVMSDSIDTLVEWGGLEPAAKEKVKTFYTNDYLPK